MTTPNKFPRWRKVLFALCVLASAAGAMQVEASKQPPIKESKELKTFVDAALGLDTLPSGSKEYWEVKTQADDLKDFLAEKEVRSVEHLQKHINDFLLQKEAILKDRKVLVERKRKHC